MTETVQQTGAVTTQGADPTSTSGDAIMNGTSNDVNLTPNLDKVVQQTQTRLEDDANKPTVEVVVEDKDDDAIVAAIDGKSRKPSQLENNTNGQSKVEPAPIVAPVPETWETEKTALLAKMQKYESRQAAIEEFEKDKVGFVAKYIPGVILESFQPVAYVQFKIDEKYAQRNESGELIPFIPDPIRALTPGTPDYNYRLDLAKFEQEAQAIMANANTSVESSKQEGVQRFETAKAAVKTKYGLTDEQFKTYVWDELEQIDNGNALELMAEAIMSRKKIDAINNNISNGVKRTEIPPSVLDVNTVSKVVDEEDELYGKLFGRKR